jgi:hypothetical protein
LVDGSLEIASKAIRSGDVQMVWNANCETCSPGRSEFLGYEIETSRTRGLVILGSGEVVRMEGSEFATMTAAPTADPPHAVHRLKLRSRP